MRGTDAMQESLFMMAKLEDFVPSDHPLRAIRELVNDALVQLNALFNGIYADNGRASIAPERLMRALLLQVFYSVRSERQLCEQLRYNLLFRWFVGLAIDDTVWDHSVFSKNRDRLMEHAVVEAFFGEVMRLADGKGLLSKEHFSVDGTLIQAWASIKSFRQKKDQAKTQPPDDPGNPTVDFRGEQRRNDTHQSTTDPQARLYRKGGAESLLSFLGHLMIENRNGLVVSAQVSLATGTAERDTALDMIKEIAGKKRITIGADKAYDTKEFVRNLRNLKVTPHVAQNICRNRHSAIDNRTTSHTGYEWSQKKRKRIEEVFGWLKTVGLMKQTRYRGTDRVGWMFTFAAAAYNLVRMRTLLARV